MQGLLKQGQSQQPPNRGPQQGRQPAPPQDESTEGMIKQGMEEDDGLDEDHPVFQAGMKWVRTVLYSKDGANKYAKMFQKASDLADVLANTTYELIEVADTKSQGDLPRELLALFASFVMQELVDVAETAGTTIEPAQIATAWKTIVQRYLGEQGADTQEIAEAMDQVDPQVFNQAVAADRGEQQAGQPMPQQEMGA